MKMLKKAGALAIAGAMAMSLGTISAFADSAITLGTIEYTPATEESSIATFKVPYTAAAGVSQVTLLAELGAAEGVFANAIAYSTTAYIDQESADTYFEFKIDDSRLQLAEDQEKLFLNVKVGGTGVSTPATASLDITPVVEDEAIIGSADIKGALELKDGEVLTGVYGLENAGILRLDATSLIAENKLDLATQVVTIDGVEAVYTVYGETTKLLALVDTTKADYVVEVVAKDGGSTQLKYGDANSDTSINAGDISRLVNDILAASALESYADLSFVRDDANGDLSVNAGDISAIVNLILDESRIPAADK